ncbi:hypothetical protein [Vibrio rotiferianus]|uniref:hypothetical protein n=1 Tax=Vibrio rotiferianus TaxID=190895 RepID=UPI0038B23711
MEIQWWNALALIGWVLLQLVFVFLSFVCLMVFIRHKPLKPKYQGIASLIGVVFFISWLVMLVIPFISVYQFFDLVFEASEWNDFEPATQFFDHWWIALGVLWLCSSFDEYLRDKS